MVSVAGLSIMRILATCHPGECLKRTTLFAMNNLLLINWASGVLEIINRVVAALNLYIRILRERCTRFKGENASLERTCTQLRGQILVFEATVQRQAVALREMKLRTDQEKAVKDARIAELTAELGAAVQREG